MAVTVVGRTGTNLNQNDVGAGLGEGYSDSLADAPRATGDEGSLTLERE